MEDKNNTQYSYSILQKSNKTDNELDVITIIIKDIITLTLRTNYERIKDCIFSKSQESKDRVNQMIQNSIFIIFNNLNTTIYENISKYFYNLKAKSEIISSKLNLLEKFVKLLSPQSFKDLKEIFNIVKVIVQKKGQRNKKKLNKLRGNMESKSKEKTNKTTNSINSMYTKNSIKLFENSNKNNNEMITYLMENPNENAEISINKEEEEEEEEENNNMQLQLPLTEIPQEVKTELLPENNISSMRTDQIILVQSGPVKLLKGNKSLKVDVKNLNISSHSSHLNTKVSIPEQDGSIKEKIINTEEEMNGSNKSDILNQNQYNNYLSNLNLNNQSIASDDKSINLTPQFKKGININESTNIINKTSNTNATLPNLNKNRFLLLNNNINLHQNTPADPINTLKNIFNDKLTDNNNKKVSNSNTNMSNNSNNISSNNSSNNFNNNNNINNNIKSNNIANKDNKDNILNQNDLNSKQIYFFDENRNEISNTSYNSNEYSHNKNIDLSEIPEGNSQKSSESGLKSKIYDIMKIIEKIPEDKVPKPLINEIDRLSKLINQKTPKDHEVINIENMKPNKFNPSNVKIEEDYNKYKIKNTKNEADNLSNLNVDDVINVIKTIRSEKEIDGSNPYNYHHNNQNIHFEKQNSNYNNNYIDYNKDNNYSKDYYTSKQYLNDIPINSERIPNYNDYHNYIKNNSGPEYETFINNRNNQNNQRNTPMNQYINQNYNKNIQNDSNKNRNIRGDYISSNIQYNHDINNYNTTNNPNFNNKFNNQSCNNFNYNNNMPEILSQQSKYNISNQNTTYPTSLRSEYENNIYYNNISDRINNQNEIKMIPFNNTYMPIQTTSNSKIVPIMYDNNIQNIKHNQTNQYNQTNPYKQNYQPNSHDQQIFFDNINPYGLGFQTNPINNDYLNKKTERYNNNYNYYEREDLYNSKLYIINII